MPKPFNPATEVVPNPNLERHPRRRFSAEYKLRIVNEADVRGPREVGELLRREGLYHAQLAAWRRQLANGGLDGLAKTAPGPKPAKTPEQRRIERLECENARLSRRLEIAEDCIALQKKALSMLDRATAGNDA